MVNREKNSVEKKKRSTDQLKLSCHMVVTLSCDHHSILKYLIGFLSYLSSAVTEGLVQKTMLLILQIQSQDERKTGKRNTRGIVAERSPDRNVKIT